MATGLGGAGEVGQGSLSEGGGTTRGARESSCLISNFTGMSGQREGGGSGVMSVT